MRRSNSGGPEPASDIDDDRCMGGLVFMKMEGMPIPLPHRDCIDHIFGNCDLLRGDFLLSHLPLGFQDQGVPHVPHTS